jgi:hypothetical protein
MIKSLAIACLSLLVMSSSALASSCIVPFIKTLDNQTVFGTMYAVSGKSCGIVLIRSPGPIHGAGLVTRPSNGRVSIGGGRVAYTSRPGYVGDDRFVYARQGFDALNRPVTRTVDVTVKVTSRL